MAERKYEHPGFEYMEVSVITGIAKSANEWSKDGWETIAVVSPLPPPWTNPMFTLLLKRVKRNPYNLLANPEEFKKWEEWESRYGGPGDHGWRSSDS